MKKVIFFIIIAAFSMSLSAKRAKFPFQDPHRFKKNLTQGDYVSGNYSIGDITITEIRCGEWIYFKGAFGNDSISQQECYGPPSLFMQVYKANKPIAIDFMFANPYLITDSRENKGLIVRRDSNQIVFYLCKADGKSGVKLIFDVDKFEKFLTQTYEYDNLEKGPEIRAMVLNLTFNDDYFDFIDNRPGTKPPARSWSIPWATISYERKRCFASYNRLASRTLF